MKQLPHVKAEQRKIKWLFEVFNASLRCLVHLLEQFLGQYVLFLRVWVKKGTTKKTKQTDFENGTGTSCAVGIKSQLCYYRGSSELLVLQMWCIETFKELVWN